MDPTCSDGDDELTAEQLSQQQGNPLGRSTARRQQSPTYNHHIEVTVNKHSTETVCNKTINTDGINHVRHNLIELFLQLTIRPYTMKIISST